MTDRINHYFKDFDIDYCRQYILTECQTEYQKIQKTAQRLMENRFLFEGNWDMEPCPYEYHLEPLNWESFFDDDPEWAYMLNRQEYLLALLLGYIVEGKKEYIEQLKTFIFHWIEHVPNFHPNSLTTRSIDTGIRCFTWLKCLLFLDYFNLIQEEELEMIYQSLTKQIRFMKMNYIDKYTLSNWGMLQTIPIIACHYFLSDKLEIEDEYTFAIQELQEQIDIQILEDGTQFEQSILYHVEVYKALLELSILVPKQADLLRPLLKKMAFYIHMMTGLDGKTLALGDSDATPTDDILSLSALFLKENHLLPKETSLSLYAIFFLGRKGIEQWKQIKYSSQQAQSHLFSNSGHVCIKTMDSYFFFKNGPMGSGHTHSDQNSFCLHYKGQPIFIDAGRYTYRDVEQRRFLKSAWSHTGCIIDHTPPEMITGSWSYADYPQPLFCQYQTSDQLHYIEGAYRANQQSTPYLHLRKVLMLADKVWIIVDDIHCQGEHQLTTQFILDDTVQYEQQQLGQLKLISPTPLSLEKTEISKRYNEQSISHKLVKQQTFSHRTIDYTILADQDCQIQELPVHQSDGQELTQALAFRIMHPHFSKVVLLLADDIYSGEKLCIVDGIKMRGKCVVYDQQAKTATRLKA